MNSKFIMVRDESFLIFWFFLDGFDVCVCVFLFHVRILYQKVTIGFIDWIFEGSV